MLGTSAFAFQKGNDAPEALPFDVQHCPCVAKLGDQASLALPKGTVFIDRANLPKFFEYNEDIPAGNELGAALAPDENWLIVYSFQEVGYVKDDEKASLDADALLDQITKATEAGNEERRKRGWETMKVVGWERKPYYDESSHNLEWSIVAETTSGRVVNHNSRFLGRRGVMSANLITTPDKIATHLAAFRNISGDFSFAPDNRYTAFVKGDRVAEYGLTALILGGAAAAAAKTGLLKTLLKLVVAFWKLVVLAIVGAAGAIAKAFRNLRKPEQRETSTTS